MNIYYTIAEFTPFLETFVHFTRLVIVPFYTNFIASFSHDSLQMHHDMWLIKHYILASTCLPIVDQYISTLYQRIYKKLNGHANNLIKELATTDMHLYKKIMPMRYPFIKKTN